MEEYETMQRREEWSHDMMALFFEGQRDREHGNKPASDNDYYLRGYKSQSDLEEVKKELWI